MNKNIITLASILFLLSPGLILADKEIIIAKVNNKPIYENDIKNKIKNYLEVTGTQGEIVNYNQLDPSEQKEVIKTIILSDLILTEAKKSNISESEDYKQALTFTENQLMQKLFLENLVKSAITENKIQDAYNKLTQEYKNLYEYKVSHILVSTEKEASSIKKRLSNGENFIELAKEFSQDTNKEDGGSLDYFSKGQMVEPFEKAVFKMKINEISNPVATDFGYHIIMLEDKRKATEPSLEDLKPKIIDELTGQFIQKYIEKIKNKNKVEFF
jgi:peptidyl-prolyl cis-trans isomerase C